MEEAHLLSWIFSPARRRKSSSLLTCDMEPHRNDHGSIYILLFLYNCPELPRQTYFYSWMKSQEGGSWGTGNAASSYLLYVTESLPVYPITSWWLTVLWVRFLSKSPSLSFAFLGWCPVQGVGYMTRLFRRASNLLHTSGLACCWGSHWTSLRCLSYCVSVSGRLPWLHPQCSNTGAAHVCSLGTM